MDMDFIHIHYYTALSRAFLLSYFVSLMGVGVAIFKNTAWQSSIMQRQDGVKKSSFCLHRTFCYFFTKQKCKKQGEFDDLSSNCPVTQFTNWSFLTYFQTKNLIGGFFSSVRQMTGRKVFVHPPFSEILYYCRGYSDFLWGSLKLWTPF